jgi:SAM-dependent methyltransferase
MNGNCRYSEILFGAIVAKCGYPKKIIELGCGIGRNLSMFKYSICRVGIDPYKRNLNIASKNYAGIDFVRGDHSALLPYNKKFFDVAFTCSVMDHIDSPNSAIRSLIKISDKVVLFEPMVSGISRKATKSETGRYRNTWYHDYKKILKRYKHEVIGFPLYDYWSGQKFKMILVG